MFKDYYAILEVSETATQDEIKVAFKRQALKWHPDKNPAMDTNQRMQEINEAYLILKDVDARERYNREYQRFKEYQQQKESAYQQEQRQKEQYSQHREQQKERTYEYSEYSVEDDILKKWMDNAKRQAVDLAKQTIEDLKGMVSVGAKAAAKEAGNQFIYQIIIGVVVLIIFGLVRACNNNQTSSTSVPISNQSTAIKPIEIANDTFVNKNSYESYLIKDVGSIYISTKMELQSGSYKKLTETAQKEFAQKFNYEISDDRIVFQQKGLNTLDKKGFGSYARVIIETTIGKENDYLKMSDTLSLQPNELTQLNSQMEQQVTQSFQGTGLHLIKWEGVKLVSVNNKPAIKISYLRQLQDHPYVHVDLYQFQNNDRMHLITLSYREQDSTTWKPLYPKIIKSFKLTNIK